MKAVYCSESSESSVQAVYVAGGTTAFSDGIFVHTSWSYIGLLQKKNIKLLLYNHDYVWETWVGQISNVSGSYIILMDENNPLRGKKKGQERSN